MDSDCDYDCSDDGYAASSSGNDNDCKEMMSDEEDIAMEQEDQDSPRVSAGNVVLTRDDLQKEMNDMIKEATEIVEISPGAIRILLNHFKWDMENLLERFYECSNLDTFLQRARVNPDPAKLGDGKDRRKAECDICCSMVVLTGLRCRHYACKPCWERYLTTKVLVDSTSIIECLYPGCKLLVDDEHFHTLTGKNNVVKKAFSRLTLNNFVESNRKLRWCPGTGCEKAVKITSTETRAVECSCKCRFCFECGKEWHEPMDCALLRKWLQKCVDDSETSNWISANTKDCPKCHTTIEKNGGCNHMTCKSTACTYEFCWICMGDWKAHKDAYNCSRYVESGTVKDSRAALEKYLHYYNRYMNHQNSLKLENKLYDSVRAKMDLMQRVSTMSWVEVQFLLKAVDVLSECRRTLMFAYAFAYYVKQGNELFIFEDNQRDLEIATEQLSGFLEQDLDQILQSENMITLKQKVQDKYRYVEHRRNVLLNHCTEGTERDAWQFNNY